MRAYVVSVATATTEIAIMNQNIVEAKRFISGAQRNYDDDDDECESKIDSRRYEGRP